MSKRTICLSVSKRNQNTLEIVDDYSLEWGLERAPTLFRIAREYDRLRKQQLVANEK